MGSSWTGRGPSSPPPWRTGASVSCWGSCFLERIRQTRRSCGTVARQALPLLYLRQGDPYSAKSLLATAEVQGTEWHEARYLLGLLEDPTPQQRLDALGKLLEEQYLEPYMTEYAAVCLLAGQEKKGLHMAKRQLRLFPGGTYERQARMLLEEGVPAAQPFLSQLEAQRGLRSVQPYHASPAASFRDTSPHPDPAEEAAVPVQSLPEPVKRCFDGVVGMPRARQVLLQLYNTMQYQKSRQDYQLETRRHFHFLIRGAQGSGKSMLANRISAFLHELKAATDPAPCLLESYQLSGYLSGAGSELTDALAQCQDRTVIVDGIAPLFAASDSGAPLAKLFYKLLEPFQESLNLILIGTDAHIDRLLSLEPTAAGMSTISSWSPILQSNCWRSQSVWPTARGTPFPATRPGIWRSVWRRSARLLPSETGKPWMLF